MGLDRRNDKCVFSPSSPSVAHGQHQAPERRVDQRRRIAHRARAAPALSSARLSPRAAAAVILRRPTGPGAFSSCACFSLAAIALDRPTASGVAGAAAQTYPTRHGQLHPAVRARQRRRHGRAAGRRPAGDALGQAGGDRESSGRRRPGGDQRLHRRQRRPHAAVRAGRRPSRCIPTSTRSCPTTPSATSSRSRASPPSSWRCRPPARSTSARSASSWR